MPLGEKYRESLMRLLKVMMCWPESLVGSRANLGEIQLSRQICLRNYSYIFMIFLKLLPWYLSHFSVHGPLNLEGITNEICDGFAWQTEKLEFSSRLLLYLQPPVDKTRQLSRSSIAPPNHLPEPGHVFAQGCTHDITTMLSFLSFSGHYHCWTWSM